MISGLFLLTPGIAFAQGESQGFFGPYEKYLLYPLFLLFMLITGYFAKEAFGRGAVVLAEVPTLPRYMTRKPLYVYGIGAFVALSLFIYTTIVAFYKPFLPFVKFISTPLYDVSLELSNSRRLTYPVIIILAAVVFAALLKLEHKWNPVLLLRNIVYMGVAIPRKAKELIDYTKDTLSVPDNAKSNVVEDPNTQHVAIVDFEKNRGTLDRKWAEASYMRQWLGAHETSGSHATFFNEPSLRWKTHGDIVGVQEEYIQIAASVGPLKSGAEGIEGIENAVNDQVDRLYGNFCRLVACFLVYKNSEEEKIWRDAEAFGISHGKIFIHNPLSRFILFVVGVPIAIYFGCASSAVAFDKWHGVGFIDSLSQINIKLINTWTLYGLALNCTAIFCLLLWHYVSEKLETRHQGFHGVRYAWYFVVGMLVAGVVLSVLLKLFSDDDKFEGMGVLEVFGANFQWALVPGIICAFLGFRMDSSMDIETPIRTRIIMQTGWALGLGAIAALMVVLPAFAIVSLPPGYEEWGIPKLRAVIFGTTLVTGIVVGFLAYPAQPKRPI